MRLIHWVVLGLLAPSATGALADETRLVAGWVEPVVLLPQQINFLAKLDSGARNSSLNSKNITIVQHRGEDQVRFQVSSRDGEQHTLQLPLLKHAKIKRHFGKSQQRPVVMMEICLGNIRKTVPVNLVDRSGFNYQLLLGRSFLAPKILIDSSTTKTLAPQCR